MTALHPGGAFAFSHPAHVLAFGFGAGLVRVAPGTAGSAVALVILWLVPFSAAGVMVFLWGGA